MSTVINPKTGRRITVGGATWNQLSPRMRQTALHRAGANEVSTSLRDLPRDVVVQEIVSRLSPTSRKMAWHAKLLPEDMLSKENEKNRVSPAWVWKSIENLDYAMKRGYPKPNPNDPINYNEYSAIYYGSLPVLQHAKRVYHFFELPNVRAFFLDIHIQECLQIAAGKGKKEVFSWLFEQFARNLGRARRWWWKISLMKTTLEFRQYDFFQWMIETYFIKKNQSKWIYRALLKVVHIAPEKRLELLTWTHSQCHRSDHVDFLLDFQEEEVPLPLMSSANLETIQWLFRKKIYFNQNLHDYAMSGDVKIIEWAIQKLNLSLDNRETRTDLMNSGSSGKKEVFEWLLSQGYSINMNYTEHTTSAAVAGHFGLLKWLVDEQRCDLDPQVITSMTEDSMVIDMAYPRVNYRLFEWVYDRTQPNLRETVSSDYAAYVFELEEELENPTTPYTCSKQIIRVLKKNMQETAKILAFLLEKDPELFGEDKERILQIIQKYSHPRKSTSSTLEKRI